MAKKGILVSLVIWNLVFTIILRPLGTNLIYAQERCEVELERAKRDYFSGRFERAIVLAANCIEEGNLSEDQLKQAYRLLGLTYLALDQINQARQAISKLLILVPNYSPDPMQDPPPYTQIVEDVKKQLSAEKQKEEQPAKVRGSKKFLFIGGGAVVAAAIAVLFLRGGGDGPGPINGLQDLPRPPDDPVRN